MCNLYATMRMRAEVAAFARVMVDRNNNQPPLPAVFPDCPAPIVARDADGARVMFDARWGMPSSRKALLEAATRRADKLRAKGADVDFPALLRMEPDGGTTNVRNVSSPHWRPFLGPERRCLVPFTAFAEPNQVGGMPGENVWFALGEDRPLGFFAGVWTPWTCVRKVKEGEVTSEVFGFLTTHPNTEVGAVHAKAMPVILATEAERDLWLSDAPFAEVAHLQRPLADGALTLVARGLGLKRDDGRGADQS